MAPLLDPTHPAPFIRKDEGVRLLGKVFSQYMNQHRKHNAHPFLFYVEYPDDGPCYEISAKKLAGIIGDGAVNRSFSRAEIARTLERLQPDTNLRKLLPSLKP